MTALARGIAPVVRQGLAAQLSYKFFFAWSKAVTFSSKQENCGIRTKHKL